MDNPRGTPVVWSTRPVRRLVATAHESKRPKSIKPSGLRGGSRATFCTYVRSLARHFVMGFEMATATDNLNVPWQDRDYTVDDVAKIRNLSTSQIWREIQ